jgi:hypothetical protein
MTDRLIVAAVLAASLGTTAGAQTMASPPPAAMTAGPVTITLNAQNNSGETGTATLAQTGGGLVVTLTLTPSPAGPQPAHIHKGTCAKLDPAPAYPLTSVAPSSASGTSTTTLTTVTLAQLAAGQYAINVHKSASDIKTYVACGDITIPSAAKP